MRVASYLQTAIIEWVKRVLPSVTPVMAKQEISRETLTLPYLVIDFISAGVLEGVPELEYISEDVYKRPFRELMTVSINIYADSSDIDYMDTLRRSVHLEPEIMAFSAAGIAFREMSAGQDLSSLLDSKYQERYQSDFIFGYSTEVTENNGEIHRVSGTGIREDFDYNIN